MTDDDTTRVRAYTEDKDRINNLRRGDDTQADVIRRLLGPERPLSEDMERIREETDEWTPLEDLDDEFDASKADVEAIMERLDEIEPGSLSYGDVKEATRAAIREELPVSEMGR